MSKMKPQRARDVSALDTGALRCTYHRRHSFPLPRFVPTYFDGQRALRADMNCPDCGTRKVIYISQKSYELWSTFYIYEDGYLVEGGTPDKEDIVKEIRARLSPQEVAEERKLQRQLDAERERERKAAAAAKAARVKEREARAQRTADAVEEVNNVVRLRLVG